MEKTEELKSEKGTPVKEGKGSDKLPEITKKFPEHIVQLVLILKNNAEVRRFTSLGILKALGKDNGRSYVTFKWNKFAVKSDGLVNEYSYKEAFFLNSFVASFESVALSSQYALENFCVKELGKGQRELCSDETIDEIVKNNNKYINCYGIE